MLTQERDRFVAVISGMAETFGKEVTEATFTGYWMGLSDLPLDSVIRAVENAIRTSKFMPTVADLRECSGVETVADRAVIAFDALKKAVGGVGHYESVQFDDPAITATVRCLGGWHRITGLESEEFNKWFRKDFEKTYAAYARRGVTEEQAQPLLGFHDTNNMGKGHRKEAEHIHLITTGLEPTKLIDGGIMGVFKQIEAAQAAEADTERG